MDKPLDVWQIGNDRPRYVCTAESPWTPEKFEAAEHPDAINDGDCVDGCCDKKHCPHCGTHWRERVPA